MESCTLELDIGQEAAVWVQDRELVQVELQAKEKV